VLRSNKHYIIRLCNLSIVRILALLFLVCLWWALKRNVITKQDSKFFLFFKGLVVNGWKELNGSHLEVVFVTALFVLCLDVEFVFDEWHLYFLVLDQAGLVLAGMQPDGRTALFQPVDQGNLVGRAGALKVAGRWLLADIPEQFFVVIGAFEYLEESFGIVF